MQWVFACTVGGKALSFLLGLNLAGCWPGMASSQVTSVGRIKPPERIAEILLGPERLCPPKLICGNPNPSETVLVDGAFVRWLGHKGGILHRWESVLLQKRPQRDLLPLTSCKDTARMQPSINQEASSLQTLTLPASWSWRNKWLLFEPPRLEHFWYWSPNEVRQIWKKKRSLCPNYIVWPLNPAWPGLLSFLS